MRQGFRTTNARASNVVILGWGGWAAGEGGGVFLAVALLLSGRRPSRSGLPQQYRQNWSASSPFSAQFV
jgi:hypothetical protein